MDGALVGEDWGDGSDAGGARAFPLVPVLRRLRVNGGACDPALEQMREGPHQHAMTDESEACGVGAASGPTRSSRGLIPVR
jgi:hypothetical protein